MRLLSNAFNNFYTNNMTKIIILPLLFLFSVNVSICQTPDSLLDRIIKEQCNRGDSSGLFLHTDKSIFVRGENVWFTAYNAYDSANVLYVLLANRIKGTVAIFDKFTMSNGIGHGYLFLQDTLEAGEYMLIAYTNNFPSGIFRQPISIRASKKETFVLTTHRTDSLLTCNIALPEGGLAASADFYYKLCTGSTIIRTEKTRVNDFGEVNIILPENYKEKKITLLANVRLAKRICNYVVPIVAFPDRININLFPEGGNMVANHVTRCGIELKNLKGVAISTEGCLYEDTDCIAAFKTDVYGRGHFDFVPKLGKRYKIHVDDHDDLIQQFPPIRSDGFSLHMKKAIVDDSLPIEVYPAIADNNCIILIHNSNFVLTSLKVSDVKSAGGRIIIPCAGFPSGPTFVTLTDMAGNLQCEREILIDHNQKANINIVTDSASYHKRSKVTVKIKATNEKGAGIMSAFSLSGIFSRLLDTTKSRNINHIDFGFFDTKAQLENLLIMQAHNRNLQSYPSISSSLYGRITYNGKKITEPVTIFVTGQKKSILQTNENGDFEITADQQIDSAEKSISIISFPMQGHKPADYTISIMESNYNKINDSLAAIYYPFENFTRDSLSIEERNSLSKTLPEVKVLTTVTVTAFETNSWGPEYHSKTCNDWVCPYNILNCQNHKFGRTPVDGETYLYGGHMITYHAYEGCKPISPIFANTDASFLRKVKAVHLPKDFYVVDYSKFNPHDPEINTTVFWNYKIVTDQNGEATIVFYTNDLTGRFCLVAQGVSENGPLSGKSYFNVVNE